MLDNLLALLRSAGIDINQDAVRFIRFPESCTDIENPSVLLINVCVPVVGVSQTMSGRQGAWQARRMPVYIYIYKLTIYDTI